MKVLVAGATGTLGGPLVRRLNEHGHEVTGIARSAEGAQRLASLNASAVTADVMDAESLRRAVDGRHFDAVIHELTALKRAPARHADMAATNALRTTGSAHLLDAAQRVGARRFITQSIVFGYGYRDHGAQELTEESPFGVPQGDVFDRHVAAMVSAEQQAMSTRGIEGIALRYGLFYGADLDKMERMLRRRMLPLVRTGGEIPFVHHEDAAAATVAALERGSAGRVYNVVDDTPARFADLIAAIQRRRDLPAPLVIPPWVLGLAAPYAKALFGVISMRVSNDRAVSELGWSPAYPSVADGVAAG